MLVYKDIKQLLYVLGSFYQPQNSYCIAVDEKAASSFKKRIQKIAACFPNIFLHEVRNVEYCGFGVTNAVFSCLKILANQNNPWKYYQYLSGVDLPLKTNLEMVRIFKALNKTYNAEVTKVDAYRIDESYGAPPVPLWKSSLSATFPRESADVIVRNQKVNDLLLYLRRTECSDESLWGTIGGQPEYIPIPGGFPAPAFYRKIKDELYGNPRRPNFSKSKNPKSGFELKSYYISRYQVWDSNDELSAGLICKGSFVKKSCVYGIEDLPNLITRPELVAHKFYLDLHPAVFFCLYEKVRLRSLDVGSQSIFSADNYRNLPQVQLSQGKKIDEVNFFF
ncbi:hypothetical protein FO519_009329 [Halicephalobus sp. NKZ332]|nr:hypothetical protein FO519_009329 [Halicephalobus sp. NKZ332]